MKIKEFERSVQQISSQWAYIKWVETLDKTEHTIKLRVHVDTECFIQIYTNITKGLTIFTLVLNRTRIFGHDCEGGVWHRHPHHAPNTHDYSAEGSQVISLSQFLAEAQQILQTAGIL